MRFIKHNKSNRLFARKKICMQKYGQKNKNAFNTKAKYNITRSRIILSLPLYYAQKMNKPL
jgi:hypothetical protein